MSRLGSPGELPFPVHSSPVSPCYDIMGCYRNGDGKDVMSSVLNEPNVGKLSSYFTVTPMDCKIGYTLICFLLGWLSMSFGSSCVVFGGLCAIVMERFPLTPPFFLIREKERTKIFRNTQGVAAPRKTINVDSMIQKRCVRSEYTAFCRVTLQLPIA